MDSKQYSYKQLVVWQKSMDLVTFVYALTALFPKSELYGLTSQMRRCSVSIPSNIAEGRRRTGKKEYIQFLTIAYASGAELETQIEISKRLRLAEAAEYKKIDLLLVEVLKMLNTLLSMLKS